MERQIQTGTLNKLLKMTGDRARLDAKAKDSYIVYYTNDGMVKEYPNGVRLPIVKNKHE